jgi:hypothetical protein
MTDIEVKQALEAAVKALKTETRPLDFRVVHERSTAHRLAVQLESHFKTWDVDCESDRDEQQLKKMLMGIDQCKSEKTTDGVFPDIVVHHRGGEGPEHNLLVVELKKRVGFDPCDDRKLELFTDPQGHYQYQIGLYININSGKFDCTWYKNGMVG